jgi:hypothetical protein
MAQHAKVPVVAAFSTRIQAEGAIEELWRAGFPKAQIGLAALGEPMQRGTTAAEGLEDNAATGAVAGAVTGGAVGALAGALVVAAIPGVGEILTGGLLMGIATGAAAGAALGSFAGPFVALGFSKKTARQYETDLRAGRSIVLVQTDRPEEAMLVLHSHDPISVDIADRRVHEHTPA